MIYRSRNEELPLLPKEVEFIDQIDYIDQWSIDNSAKAVWELLDLMTPFYKEILLMVYKLEMTDIEISKALSIRLGSIKELKRIAINKLYWVIRRKFRYAYKDTFDFMAYKCKYIKPIEIHKLEVSEITYKKGATPIKYYNHPHNSITEDKEQYEKLNIEIIKENKKFSVYTVYSSRDYNRHMDIKSFTYQKQDHFNLYELYHHTPDGDYISKRVVEDNIYKGERRNVWSNTFAPIGIMIPALVSNMPEKLVSGECFTAIRNASLLAKIYVFKNVLTISDGHIALKVINADNDWCYIVQPV